ncbi:MAG: hypothetical protein AWU58_354 [Methanohalophilus sp. T328-1]|jgi:hypothetical protein|uniref:DNA polymerase subunit beta n=1 Tax=Methanohalophilus euhalobius TaxID=51203 RepID=A0A285EXM8_9EURY|nr:MULTISPECIES: DNA polymerase subunit beta [Methanohalophilus]KXS46667.1 MAG: hypothetical protein AWU58_354 [Methanohalophilus sp. T328-1]RSD33489.1 MAG: hypothetical protein CI952_1547 [Methanohalophilus sp.]OBZ34919.1 MAG: DNA polymerase subunit beta [Methanohalophilus sp. DAL1]ODV50466.1 MAG: hypothetical protein A8273_7 [Methanohalophilus sp. 2-GBenrich]RSD35230.1 MAG: hypothetical protein CI953_267 [Methanohalophilus sp.]
MIRTRLRDFVRTDEDCFFSVVDYFHPDGIRGILRYAPDEEGNRFANGMKYRKYDFADSFDYMRKHHPDWIADVHIIPQERISEILSPVDRVPEVVDSDEQIKTIVTVLSDAGIPMSKQGVTGSILPGLQNDMSDIDFVIYGPDWFKARDAINRAKLSSSLIEAIDENMWQRIYRKRSPEISYDEFLLHELRKGNRGMVNGTYFDLLFTRDWDQIHQPLERGTDTKHIQIKATVTDATFAFDNPALYKIDHEEIDHILSYTHTYSGQALTGERIEARGVVEELGHKKRLVVGTSREPRGEWMRSLTLLEKEGLL